MTCRSKKHRVPHHMKKSWWGSSDEGHQLSQRTFPHHIPKKNNQVSLDVIKRILTSLPSRKNSSSSERFCPLCLFISKKINIFAVERDSPEYVTDVGSRVCFISITRWSIPFFLDLKKLIAVRQVVIKAFRKLSG